MALAPNPLTKTAPAVAPATTAAPAPGTTPAPAATPAPGVVDPAVKPQRPEGFGEAFNAYWNEDTGADYSKLGEDFAALSELKAETDSRAAQVPENVEDYEVALPDGFEAPEGFEFQAVKDHPALGDAREFAKANGLTKDGFKQLVGLQAKVQLAEFNQLKAAADQQRALLGSKATQRVDALTTWLQAKLGNDHANALLPMMYTAKQVEAFEKLIEAAKGGGPKINAGGRETNQPNTEITDDEWAKLSPAKKIDYGRSHPAAKAKGS